MKRLARVVAVGVPHHVTQRGNGRQFFAEAVRSRWASPGHELNLRERNDLIDLEMAAMCMLKDDSRYGFLTRWGRHGRFGDCRTRDGGSAVRTAGRK
jgi:hypothetical protein